MRRQTAALADAITLKDGMVEQSNFNAMLGQLKNGLKMTLKLRSLRATGWRSKPNPTAS